MFQVNRREFQWTEGLTVEDLINILRDTGEYDPILKSNPSVVINKRKIPPAEYANWQISDEDNINIFPVMVGG